MLGHASGKRLLWLLRLLLVLLLRVGVCRRDCLLAAEFPDSDVSVLRPAYTVRAIEGKRKAMDWTKMPATASSTAALAIANLID